MRPNKQLSPRSYSVFDDFLAHGLTYIAILCLFILPFLSSFSYFPLGTFYSELVALVCAVLVGAFALLRSRRVGISSATIAVFLFAIYLVLQIFLVPIRFPGINIVVAIEFGIGGMLSLGISSLIASDTNKQKQLALVIFYGVFIGAFIQALYGILQYTGIAANFVPAILFINTNAVNVVGNVGQKNDYVTYLSMGLFALSYLYFIGKIRWFIYAPFLLFFLLIISITTSRTPFVFFIFAMIISVSFWFKNRNKKDKLLNAQNKKIVLMMIAIAIALLFIEAVLPKIIALFASRADVTSGLYRFEANTITQSTYRRFYEWYKAIMIFLAHPLWGIGWHQYIKAAIDIMLTPRFMYIPGNTALYTHCHNSLLNVLAEAGLVGFVISFVYGFAYTLYRMFKAFNDHVTLFVSFMVFAIFGQSLLQFPLWYSYFLMYFIALLSLNKPVMSFNNSKWFKMFVMVVVLLFVYFCASSIATYSKIIPYAQVPEDLDDYKANVNVLKSYVNENIIWSYPALMVLDAYNMPGSIRTDYAFTHDEQAKYADMLGNELPYASMITKQMITHRLIGDRVGALYYANLLAHAFPLLRSNFADSLASSPLFSEDVAKIREFNYEDRSVFASWLGKAKQ